jgi:hypothetical protein
VVALDGVAVLLALAGGRARLDDVRVERALAGERGREGVGSKASKGPAAKSSEDGLGKPDGARRPASCSAAIAAEVRSSWEGSAPAPRTWACGPAPSPACVRTRCGSWRGAVEGQAGWEAEEVLQANAQGSPQPLQANGWRAAPPNMPSSLPACPSRCPSTRMQLFNHNKSPPPHLNTSMNSAPMAFRLASGSVSPRRRPSMRSAGGSRRGMKYQRARPGIAGMLGVAVRAIGQLGRGVLLLRNQRLCPFPCSRSGSPLQAPARIHVPLPASTRCPVSRRRVVPAAPGGVPAATAAPSQLLHVYFIGARGCRSPASSTLVTGRWRC